MPSLFLSTPCYGGQCLQKYAESVLRLQILMSQVGIQMYIDTIENESLVQRARNVAVGRFMQKSEAEYFMFIDADVHFEPEAVVRLIQSGHELSVACYPKKFVDWNQAAAAAKKGDQRNMAMLSASLVVNFGVQRVEITNGFAPVLDGPTGFMLIKREVFQKLEKAFPILLGDIQRSWADNDQLVRFPVSFTYSHWKYEDLPSTLDPSMFITKVGGRNLSLGQSILKYASVLQTITSTRRPRNVNDILNVVNSGSTLLRTLFPPSVEPKHNDYYANRSTKVRS